MLCQLIATDHHLCPNTHLKATCWISLAVHVEDNTTSVTEDSVPGPNGEHDCSLRREWESTPGISVDTGLPTTNDIVASPLVLGQSSAAWVARISTSLEGFWTPVFQYAPQDQRK
jgi:hypothetical protein